MKISEVKPYTEFITETVQNTSDTDDYVALK